VVRFGFYPRCVEILRYSAFSDDPAGGNPAGVVLAADGLDEAEMLRVAAEVGYSETAFLTAAGDNRFQVRYFSPLAEVPFCGHATIASAVAYAERHGAGQLTFETKAGTIEVSTETAPDGANTATLVSVAPRTREISAADLAALLATLGWTAAELDPALPPRVAYAGAWHPVLAAATRRRLAELDYDFAALGALMARHDWTTIQLVWRASAAVFQVRNPFPPGGVVEDPATGAAAAALGGYLRELGQVDPPATVALRQGEEMGRPSRLLVGIGPGRETGITVTGAAVRMTA
jgi:PhzF family phenazine biosynthesis protein